MFRKTRGALALGMLAAAVWASTFATFTDEGTASSTFTAGTVDILLNSEADDAYAFTSLEMSNMKPGDVKYAPLTVRNDGTLGFTYTMATSVTAGSSALADELQAGIKQVANAGACAQAGYDASGDTMTAEGDLSGAAIASRALSAATEEVACFKVELPSGTLDTFQGATVTVTFTFSATQS